MWTAHVWFLKSWILLFTHSPSLSPLCAYTVCRQCHVPCLFSRRPEISAREPVHPPRRQAGERVADVT